MGSGCLVAFENIWTFKNLLTLSFVTTITRDRCWDLPSQSPNCSLIVSLLQFLATIHLISFLWHTQELVLWWNIRKVLFPVSFRSVCWCFTGLSHRLCINHVYHRTAFWPCRKVQFHRAQCWCRSRCEFVLSFLPCWVCLQTAFKLQTR